MVAAHSVACEVGIMKHWKIGIVLDSAKPSLGLHGLHVAFNGLPNVQVVGYVDSNEQDIEQKRTE